MRTDAWAARRPGRTRSGATREALRSRPRRRPRPRIRPRGVMEYWSVGVLRQLGIAPRDREVGATFRALRFSTVNPGLKPWAESFRPFGAGPEPDARNNVAIVQSWARRDFRPTVALCSIKIFPNDFFVTPAAKTIIIKERLAISKPQA
jgi:hypothetical protein